jgi:hypothetical protein
MKRKLFLCFGLSYFFIHSLFGQSISFNNSYSGLYPSEAIELDSNYLWFTTAKDSGGLFYEVYRYMVDRSGILKDSSLIYSASDTSNVLGVFTKRTSDQGYVVAVNDLYAGIVLLKFDDLHNLTQQKTFTKTSFKFNFATQMIIDEDQSILITGGGTGAFRKSELLLVKFNNQLDLVWEHTFQSSDTTVNGYDIFEHHGYFTLPVKGGYLVLGVDTDSIANRFNSNDSTLVYISLIDSSTKQMVWRKSFYDSAFYGIAGIGAISDTLYYLIHAKRSLVDYNPFTLGSTDVFLQEFSRQSVFQTPTKIVSSWPNVTLRYQSCADSGFILSGGFYHYLQNPSQHIIEGESCISKFDQSGTLEWFNKYRYLKDSNALNYISNTIETKDGGYLATGTLQKTNSPYHKVWAFKVDSKGLFVSLSEENRLVFSMHPNPTSKSIHLELASSHSHSVAILDFAGRLVMQRKTPPGNNIELDVSDLTKGSYIIQIRDDNGTIGSSKFIKQ